MRHLDLFSGIGGFALAATWTWKEDYETVAFVERESFCQRVLAKHWPSVPILGDVRECIDQDFGKIDLLTGGFPCQPFSNAGKQKGKEDDRYLWPTMLEIIAQQRPTWIIGENVPGIIGMALDQVLLDLENQSYASRTFIVPACGTDAPHRRDRIWIVANSQGERLEGRIDVEDQQKEDVRLLSARPGERSGTRPVANTSRKLLHRGGPRAKQNGRSESADSSQWPAEPGVGRVANGIPSQVDRLRGLGNAIVPQVAANLMSFVKKEQEKLTNKRLKIEVADGS